MHFAGSGRCTPADLGFCPAQLLATGQDSPSVDPCFVQVIGLPHTPVRECIEAFLKEVLDKGSNHDSNSPQTNPTYFNTHVAVTC